MGALVKQNFPTLINSFFDDWVNEGNSEIKHSPEVQIEKGDKSYRVVLPIPGAVKDKLKVSVEDNYLKISGEYSKITKDDHELVRRDFRYFESFERWLRIDENKFELESISAELKDGLLEVVLPLKKEEQKKQIDVKVK